MLCILSSISKIPKSFIGNNNNTLRGIHLTASCEAARKGTREKARKKKVKVEIKKIGFIPHNLREKNKQLTKINKHIDDSWKAIPKDNCYVGRYYRWTVYSVPEAIQCQREVHHPTMCNMPNAPLNVEIELNMQGEKVTRFVDNFQRIAMIPHKFNHGEQRNILVFTKNNDSIMESKNAGATVVAGGIDLIKDIQNGDLLLSDYQYIIANPEILPEMVSIRGLLKRRFPNPKSGTLGTNLIEMIAKFSTGISYAASKDENQKDFGKIVTSIGTLDMDIKHLEENLISLLNDINSIRPKRAGKFITRVLLKSPPNCEQLKIDPFVYIPEEYVAKSSPNNKEKIEKEDDKEADIKTEIRN